MINAAPQRSRNGEIGGIDVAGKPCAVAVSAYGGMWWKRMPCETAARRTIINHDTTGTQQTKLVPAIAVSKKAQRFVQFGRYVSRRDGYATLPPQALEFSDVAPVAEIAPPLPCPNQAPSCKKLSLGEQAIRRQRRSLPQQKR
jgi:hypothetical protein